MRNIARDIPKKTRPTTIIESGMRDLCTFTPKYFRFLSAIKSPTAFRCRRISIPPIAARTAMPNGNQISKGTSHSERVRVRGSDAAASSGACCDASVIARTATGYVRTSRETSAIRYRAR